MTEGGSEDHFAVPGIAGGGILAAGEGSRLRRDGFHVSKPLVRIGGVPLLEHAIENFLAAGIAPLAILFNEMEDDCVRFVARNFPGRGIDVSVRTTASTLESFREISSRLPDGRILVATVDAWCPPEEFLRFVREAASLPEEETAVGVTRLIDDERPLRVLQHGGEGRVVEIGGETGDTATAGIFLFSARARRIAAPVGLPRLRDFLRWLAASGEPVRAIEVGDVVDVDRATDVRLAEALAERFSASPRVGR
ncbi:MAG: NTP transferase domain-containing protein [Acidobacteriota bacterium]